MDFDDGTYISQISAKDLKSACLKWANDLNESEIFNFGKSRKKILIDEISREELVAIKDIKNVWCSTIDLRGKLALINIVQTDIENN